ncbi:MAG: hypothetical protein AAB817_00435, partial [Patescibacteria group bacterium]
TIESSKSRDELIAERLTDVECPATCPRVPFHDWLISKSDMRGAAERQALLTMIREVAIPEDERAAVFCCVFPVNHQFSMIELWETLVALEIPPTKDNWLQVKAAMEGGLQIFLYLVAPLFGRYYLDAMGEEIDESVADEPGKPPFASGTIVTEPELRAFAERHLERGMTVEEARRLGIIPIAISSDQIMVALPYGLQGCDNQALLDEIHTTSGLDPIVIWLAADVSPEEMLEVFYPE